jgi:hypothetical protein
LDLEICDLGFILVVWEFVQLLPHYSVI